MYWSLAYIRSLLALVIVLVVSTLVQFSYFIKFSTVGLVTIAPLAVLALICQNLVYDCKSGQSRPQRHSNQGAPGEGLIGRRVPLSATQSQISATSRTPV